MDSLSIIFSEDGGLAQALHGLKLILTEGALWPWTIIGLAPPAFYRFFSSSDPVKQLATTLFAYIVIGVLAWLGQAYVPTDKSEVQNAINLFAWSLSIILPAIWLLTVVGFLAFAKKSRAGILILSIAFSLPSILLWAVGARGFRCVFQFICFSA